MVKGAAKGVSGLAGDMLSGLAEHFPFGGRVHGGHVHLDERQQLLA